MLAGCLQGNSNTLRQRECVSVDAAKSASKEVKLRELNKIAHEAPTKLEISFIQKSSEQKRVFIRTEWNAKRAFFETANLTSLLRGLFTCEYRSGYKVVLDQLEFRDSGIEYHVEVHEVSCGTNETASAEFIMKRAFKNTDWKVFSKPFEMRRTRDGTLMIRQQQVGHQVRNPATSFIRAQLLIS